VARPATFGEDNLKPEGLFFRSDVTVGERRSLEALAEHLCRVQGLGLRA